jgi:hypothetical protein
MSISTNSIIHYTNSLDNLIGILQEGFRIKYCSERLNLGKSRYSSAAHPMISFCDIPLSASIQHFEAYGKYGIGLSKKWAFEIGINPVLYIDENSLFAENLYELIKERRNEKTNLTLKQKKEILHIKSYAKNYSGSFTRKNKIYKNYKFYDEREWRIVPDNNILGAALFSISSKAYKSNKEKYNSRISNIRLEFDAKDISYIIVERTDEIPDIIKIVRDCFGKRCTSEQLDILFSKICSTEQIIADY